MSDARYIPITEAGKGLNRQQELSLYEYVNRHPAISATRFNKDGSREEFSMPSWKHDDGQLLYHFALVNEFRRTEGI